MSNTLALIGLAHEGDKKARDTVIEENMGLVWSVVTRFKNRGVELEDLVQIGCIGLMKAVDKFNLEFEVQFSTYAVPMIMGEIKRFLRDDGIIKVSRSMKEISYKAYVAREMLEKKWGREPTILEIAEEVGIHTEDLILAMESQVEVESLQKIIYQGEGNDIELIDKISQSKDEQEELLDHILLEEVLSQLPREERELIYMRYFQEKTQSAIAKEMGISQVQVSRLEKKILNYIRGKL